MTTIIKKIFKFLKVLPGSLSVGYSPPLSFSSHFLTLSQKSQLHVVAATTNAKNNNLHKIKKSHGSSAVCGISIKNLADSSTNSATYNIPPKSNKCTFFFDYML